MKRVKFVGLDVHAETIAIAIAEQDGEVRSLGVVPNREDRKLLAKSKNKGVVVTAVGRELLGFMWAIGIRVETAQKESLQQAA
jgi:predicted Fe-Mo cluster-binding NifX family protein